MLPVSGVNYYAKNTSRLFKVHLLPRLSPPPGGPLPSPICHRYTVRGQLKRLFASKAAGPDGWPPPGVPQGGTPVPHRVFNILQLCQKLPVDCSYVSYVQLISTLQYQSISALYTLYWHHQHIYLFILCVQYILLYMVV